jgi:hypothetical protein
MSIASAKANFAAVLPLVTWVIPASASAVENAVNTKFQKIFTQQFAEEVPMTDFPFVRIHMPDRPEARESSGADLGSLKKRLYPCHLFIYWATWAKHWQGGGDYFDAIVDATTLYFSHNASPLPAGVYAGGDNIIGWGLKQAARIELPDLVDDALHWRATVGIDVIEYGV